MNWIMSNKSDVVDYDFNCISEPEHILISPNRLEIVLVTALCFRHRFIMISVSNQSKKVIDLLLVQLNLKVRMKTVSFRWSSIHRLWVNEQSTVSIYLIFKPIWWKTPIHWHVEWSVRKNSKAIAKLLGWTQNIRKTHSVPDWLSFESEIYKPVHSFCCRDFCHCVR